MVTTKRRLPAKAHYVRPPWPLSLAWAGMMGCMSFGATPETVQPFALNPSYTERIADPGVVDVTCYHESKERLDDGSFKGWNDAYCGCVDFDKKIVWLSRRAACTVRRDKTRSHENCHIENGSSPLGRHTCDGDQAVAALDKRAVSHYEVGVLKR